MNNKTFIKIGMLELRVVEEVWKACKDYSFDKLSPEYRNLEFSFTNPSLPNPIKQKHNPEYFCRVNVVSSEEVSVWDKSWLELYEVDHKYIDKSCSTEQIEEWQCNKYKVLKTKVEHRSEIIYDIHNLQEKDIIRLWNPKQVGRLENEPNIDFYFLDSKEVNNSSIAVEVWIREETLFDFNLNYTNFSEKLEAEGNEDINEIEKIINHRRSLMIKSKEIKEVPVIKIFINLFQPENFNNGEKEFLQVLNKRKERISGNVSKALDAYSTKTLDKIFNEEKKMPANDNSILIMDDGESEEAGLYFDLPKEGNYGLEKPEGFIGELNQFQSNALSWLLFREDKETETGIDMTDEPFWWDMSEELGLKHKLLVNINLNFIAWKKNIHKVCKGGILADEMGLGKTIMMIALMLANRKGQTLIITPLSLMKQWESQINKFGPSLNVHIYENNKLTDEKIKKFDIIIISECKVRSQIKKDKTLSIIASYHWFRIIIDEAHNFKNSQTAMSQVVCSLKSTYRWCLTGTPIQNSLNDLFSLIKFLRFSPWCFKNHWDSEFPKNVKETQIRHLLKIKILLRGILIRRKKNSIGQSGTLYVDLPKIEVKIHTVKMSENAKICYAKIDHKVRRILEIMENLENEIKVFNDEMFMFRKKVLVNQKKKKYYQALGLMMKLRMICCHEFLETYDNSYITHERFYEEYIKFLNKNRITIKPTINFEEHSSEKLENWKETIQSICLGVKFNCLLCNDQNNLVLTPCTHYFCQDCIETYFEKLERTTEKMKTEKFHEYEGECPHCKEKFKFKDLFDFPKRNEFDRDFSEFKKNEKIEALCGYLSKMKPAEKSVIFTSFLGMMSLISYTLKQENIPYLSVKGTDSSETRHETLTEFKKSEKVQVLIITLKTGSVGLNLECANKVFFMDPWWNPAIEEQAVGRVHRIGQTKEVCAIKFITEESIEARIIKLSTLKKQVNDSIMDVDNVEDEKKFLKSKQNLKFLLCLDETINLTNKMQPENDESFEEDQVNVFDLMIDELVEYKYTQPHNYN